MGRTIAYVGVPTSLGSYGPGQEKAPQAFRDAGFPQMLREKGLTVVDYGDLSVRRWRPDRRNPLAQHWEAVTACVRETDAHLSEAVSQGHIAVVIGGNCTVEFGVVAANLRRCESLGLIYMDLHADMNTPASTADGALDWMGVAHMLGLNGAIAQLANCWTVLSSDFPSSDSSRWIRCRQRNGVGAHGHPQPCHRSGDCQRCRAVSRWMCGHDPLHMGCEV